MPRPPKGAMRLMEEIGSGNAINKSRAFIFEAALSSGLASLDCVIQDMGYRFVTIWPTHASNRGWRSSSASGRLAGRSWVLLERRRVTSSDGCYLFDGSGDRIEDAVGDPRG
jgi:hypothetical protein